MAYLAVPTRRGSLFSKCDKSVTKLLQSKIARKAAEYKNRHTRKYCNDDNEPVVLNIGGKIFVTRKSTLRNVPCTRLSLLTEDDPHYNPEFCEYFFDRNPVIFSYILDYYRNGTMHIPRGMCSLSIKEELKFWNLSDGCVAECCRKFYFSELESFRTYEMIKEEFYGLPTYTAENTESNEILTSWYRLHNFRRMAWVFVDNHESSTLAKIFAVVYYGLVVVSIFSMFLSTLPSLRVPVRKHFLIRSEDDKIQTFNFSQDISTSMKFLLSTEQPDFIAIIDFICLMFFTVEFNFRLFVCPSIKERFKSWYTLLDILYLLPAWTTLMIDTMYPFYWQTGTTSYSFLFILDTMVIFRVFRIFRLSRHYRGLRVLLLAIKASVSELTLLVCFVMFALTIFASFVYCAEQYAPDTKYNSIFVSLWWALITLTTVGYGDFYPETTIGYLVACVCAVTGLLIIGMVVPIIAGNFHLYYGFRYAGCDDVELRKPEFIPNEIDNPLPDLDLDLFDFREGKHVSQTSVSKLMAFSNQMHMFVEESETDLRSQMSESPLSGNKSESFKVQRVIVSPTEPNTNSTNTVNGKLHKESNSAYAHIGQNCEEL